MNDVRDYRRVAWGVFLMLFGVAFLFERLDMIPPWLTWTAWWPLFVIGMGMVRLVFPRKANDIGNAVFFTLLGLWFLVAANGWYGLTWLNSWPLALIALGAGMVARAIAARWLPEIHYGRRMYTRVEEEHHAQ